jgi:hypothetical protein
LCPEIHTPFALVVVELVGYILDAALILFTTQRQKQKEMTLILFATP